MSHNIKSYSNRIEYNISRYLPYNLKEFICFYPKKIFNSVQIRIKH